jgi:D-alanyl-D-alanine carboxypeptidase
MPLSLPFRFRVASGLVALAVLLAGVTVSAAPADAKRRHAATAQKARRAAMRMPASPTDPAKDAALVVDGVTGKVLYARNENAERHPASLTKMMTLFLLFDALKAGKVTMQTPLAVSYHASIQKPTKLTMRPGQTISVDMAIRALVIRSANDVAVTIAEALGGTESHFAVMMTEKARSLGMRNTNFHNASGLPDPLQITTATDLGLLARHLAYDFPQYFPYFALSGFNYKGSWFPTHDNLIGRYSGTDGIKTGYTGASGFNLVSSVVRGGNHVIGVVMGGRTAVRRDMEMMRLLDVAFNQIAANPNMVTRINVPWQTAMAQPSTSVSSGFLLPSAPQPASPFAMAALPTNPALEDEDAAERMRAPDENFVGLPPTPRPVETAAAVPAVAAVPYAPPAPSARSPLPAGRMPVAAATPAIRPSPRPGSPVQVAANFQTQVGEGDVDVPSAQSSGRNWAIQIGAFADKNLARAQLATYAERAQDVLARASRIVAPFQSADGHTMYRARFGLFAEHEARDVCNRLTQRGQTCFATIQAR